MPGATPGNPRTPEDFNEQMTTTLYQLDLGPHTFTVLASANQRAKIDHLLDDAGEDAAILGNAILAAPEYEPGRPVPGASIIGGLLLIVQNRTALAERLSQADSAGHCSQKTPREFSEDTRRFILSPVGLHRLPLVRQRQRTAQANRLTPKTVRQTRRGGSSPYFSRATAPPEGERPALKERARAGSNRPPMTKRFWADWHGTFCFATDDETAELERFQKALAAKHGAKDAREEWRIILLCP